MSIREFAASEWQSGNTDIAEAASKFLRDALNSDDPERELYQVVYNATSHEFSRLRRALRVSGPPAVSQTSGEAAHTARESQGSRGSLPGPQDSGSPAAQRGSESQIMNGGGEPDAVPAVPLDWKALTAEQQLYYLLDEEIMVPPESGNNFTRWTPKAWRHVTFEDCERACRAFEAQIRGAREHGKYFSAARTLMRRYSVPELGDVPFDRVGRRRSGQRQSA
jgi:hypothetical protein